MNKSKDDNKSIEYEVGYGRPPKHSQFKPGRSGNPKGRPKGSKNFSTDVKDSLTEKIRVIQDGKTKKISVQQAAIARLREKALNGDAKALEKLLSLAGIYNDDQPVRQKSLSSDDQALLAIYKQRVTSGAISSEANSEAVDVVEENIDRTEPVEVKSLHKEDSNELDVEDAWAISGIDDEGELDDEEDMSWLD